MKNKKDIRKQVQKELPEFADEVNSLSVADINNRISKLAQDLNELKETEEADEYYQDLKEKIKAARSVYSDSKKIFSLKTKYLIDELKSKGGL
jgi:ABC-type Na+ transport system ATPase subunit NatA